MIIGRLTLACFWSFLAGYWFTDFLHCWIIHPTGRSSRILSSIFLAFSTIMAVSQALVIAQQISALGH